MHSRTSRFFLSLELAIVGSMVCCCPKPASNSAAEEEKRIVDYLRNLTDTSKFVHLPLRGTSDETTGFTASMGAALELAPNSIDVGLREYDNLPPLSRKAFTRLLLAGGDPHHIGEFCRRIQDGRVAAAEAIEMTFYFTFILRRSLTPDCEWVDAFVARTWNDDQCQDVVYGLKRIVLYPWPGYQEQWPEGRGTKVWGAFKEWWKANRAQLTSGPGSPIRLRL